MTKLNQKIMRGPKLEMSKQANLTRFWPALYEPNQAGPEWWNGLNFWARPAGWPVIFFPYVKCLVQNQISRKLSQQKQPCNI